MGPKTPQDIQQRTFDFGVRIVDLVDRLPRTLATESIARQLIRSGTSVGANMQEADGAESKADFIHKVSIAYKEARESRHWLATLKETKMKSDVETTGLWAESDELVKILYTIIRNSRNSLNRPPHTNPTHR